MKRWTDSVALAFALAATSAACGDDSDGSPGTGGSGTHGGGGTSRDACVLHPRSDAEDLAEVPMPTQDRSERPDRNQTCCSHANLELPSRPITQFCLAQGRSLFEEFTDTGDLIPVDGIADEALWSSTGIRYLLVRRGGDSFFATYDEVGSTEEEERTRSIEIMNRALSRL